MANRMASSSSIPILLLRGIPVLIDADLARLYGVSTRVLNQAVIGFGPQQNEPA